MQHTTIIVFIIVELVGPGLFAAMLDGRMLVAASRKPMLAAARVLLAEGIDPNALLVMRHRASAHDALRAGLGVAAALRVEDGSDGVPQFRKWKPPPSVGLSPPMRSGTEAAPEAAAELADALYSGDTP